MPRAFDGRSFASILLAGTLAAACGSKGAPLRAGGAEAAPKAPRTPLPAGARRVAWERSSIPATMEAGTKTPARVGLRNDGNVTWPALDPAEPADAARGAVRLGYRWKRLGSAARPAESPGRADLPRDLAPGESASLTIAIDVPNEPGDYVLQFELVQELVAWFGDTESKPLEAAVRVVAKKPEAEPGTPKRP